jgi:predicted RNA-binding Zn ribbon-like protein
VLDAIPDRPSRAGALTLLGGTLAFDFANTASGRGWPSHQEHLRSATDIVEWAEHVKLFSSADASWLRGMVDSDAVLSDMLLRRALGTREDIHAICIEVAAGRVVPALHLDSLARAHAANLAHARLIGENGRYVWTWEPRQWPVEALLGPVVLSALTTLTQGDLARQTLPEREMRLGVLRHHEESQPSLVRNGDLRQPREAEKVRRAIAGRRDLRLAVP